MSEDTKEVRIPKMPIKLWGRVTTKRAKIAEKTGSKFNVDNAAIEAFSKWVDRED